MLSSPALLLNLSGRPDPLRHPSPPPDYPQPPAYQRGSSALEAPHSPRASSSACTLNSSALDIFEDQQFLPSYNAAPTLAPWLALLSPPHWETSADLSLFLAPGKHCPQWGEECAVLTQALIECGAELDPCGYVQQDYMFNAVSPDILDYVRTEIPKELRNTALTFACRTEPPEALVLNPLFTDALYRLGQTVTSRMTFDMDHSTALPTAPPSRIKWMLADLPAACYPLNLTDLPAAKVEALVKALFLLACRARFRRAAERAVREAEASVVKRAWVGVFGTRWKKGDHCGEVNPDGRPLKSEDGHHHHHRGFHIPIPHRRGTRGSSSSSSSVVTTGYSSFG